MMNMEEFIQNEYELFCTGKLCFELIFTDSFTYLHQKGLLEINRDVLVAAFGLATDYRRKVLQRHLNQDSVRATSFVPANRQEERKTERRIRIWVMKQMIVSDFYQAQKEKGVKKIFNNIPEVVSLGS